MLLGENLSNRYFGLGLTSYNHMSLMIVTREGTH